ncbi:MAG: tetratricopeptide repeat protein, partial [Anaerolineales bacterium]
MVNLRVALSDLRKRLGAYISISREAVRINPAADIWVDINEIENLIKNGKYEEALGIYRGDFLAGFYVRDCPDFEHWATEERENHRRTVHEVFHRLIDIRIDEGAFKEGILLARRLIADNPLDELAQRKLIGLLSLDNQRSAAMEQYNLFKKILQNELKIEPEEETTLLFEKIRVGNIVGIIKPPESYMAIETTFHPPDFLGNEHNEIHFRKDAFVGRTQELARLRERLESSVSKGGQIVFISGEPGSGKTALVREFSQRAQEAYPNLVVAFGACNAYSGISDPYLPFREVFSMLCGNVETYWKAGIVTSNHAYRLWELVPHIGEVLVSRGPNLVNILLDGESLAANMERVSSPESNSLEKLKALTRKETRFFRRLQPDLLFEQCANVLLSLSENMPVLIYLDDLHWADSASISLLFHLGRKITRSQLMIIGTYRPTEVLLGRGGKRHPLEKVVYELKRQYGDIFLDLDSIPHGDRRQFVNDILDLEPNQLTNEFRGSLFHLTNGHPLFTIEFLRALQDRGELTQREGEWVASPETNWSTLPAKVDGVISERFGQLDDQLRQILNIGCIEGDIFTTNVVADILHMDLVVLLNKLNNELEKHHQLVKEVSQSVVGNSRITQYRISHAIVQQYLYTSLGEGERRQLHLKVGESLEKLFEGHVERVENQLAFHFFKAGRMDKAIQYHKIAAQRAHARFAYMDTVSHVDKALNLINKDDLYKKYELLSLRESANATMANRVEQLKYLRKIEKTSKTLGDIHLIAEAALRRSLFEYQMSNYEKSIHASRKAISLTRSTNDINRLAYGYFYCGRSLWNIRKSKEAKDNLEQSKNLANEQNLTALEAACLRNMGIVAELEHQISQSEEYHKKALAKHREIKDIRGEGFTLNSLGILNRVNGEYLIAKDYLKQGLVLWTSVGDLFGQASWFAHMGLVNLALGEWIECKNNLEQALSIHQQIENRNGEAFTLNDLGHLHMLLGNFDRAWNYFKNAKPIWEEIGKKLGLGWLQNYIGRYYLFIGDFSNADLHLNEALEIVKGINNPLCKAEILNNLGMLRIEMGDLESARDSVNQVIEIALEIGNRNIHAYGLKSLGKVMEKLNKLDVAIGAYQNSINLFNDIERNHIALEPMAGLARIKLLERMFSEVIEDVDLILGQIEERGIEGTDDPGSIYMTCYRVLEVAEDERASDILNRAYTFLQTRTANIKNPRQKNLFLENLKSNREIV